MKIFLDSADLNEIKIASGYGIVSGVTTNPSIVSKLNLLGKNQLYNHYEQICNCLDGPVSVELLSEEYSEMILEAQELSEIHENIVIKIPISINGIKAIKYLENKGIQTNCTLIFTTLQAMLAAQAGAKFVSPFIGRLDDINVSGLQLIKDIKTIFINYQYDTNILAASIRNTSHIHSCALIGADYCTISLALIQELFEHELSKQGIEKFKNDSKELVESLL